MPSLALQFFVASKLRKMCISQSNIDLSFFALHLNWSAKPGRCVLYYYRNTSIGFGVYISYIDKRKRHKLTKMMIYNVAKILIY